jgi:ABC-type sulfate transport system permease subunit
MTYIIAAYIIIGLVVAEAVRRGAQETLQEFWVSDLFLNLIVACVWPMPVAFGIFTAWAKVSFHCPRCSRITVGYICRCKVKH